MSGQAAVDPADRAEPLEEILITARRRIEPLQGTPLSVIAFTTEDLEARNITHLRSLQYHVPNLTLAPSQNVGDAAVNVFIRGIGQEDFIVAAEQGVAMYLDGVYLARSFGSLIDVLDVERVEVLRGPQGTLFGRNSIGGAIQIISTPPSFDSRQRASLVLGNLGRREIRGMLNEPLGDQVAVRAAIAFIDRDGYLRRYPAPGEVAAGGDRRPEGDLDSSTGRLQVRWQPTEAVTADMAFDAARRRTRQGATHVDQINPLISPLPVINGLIGQGEIPGPPITNVLAPDDLLASYASDTSFVEQDTRGISASLTRQSGQSLLKAIAAYRSLETDVLTEVDGGPLNVFNNNFHDKQHQGSLELQWNFAADRFDLTLGAFAFSEARAIHPGSRHQPWRGALHLRLLLYLTAVECGDPAETYLHRQPRRIRPVDRGNQSASFRHGGISDVEGFQGDQCQCLRA